MEAKIDLQILQLLLLFTFTPSGNASLGMFVIPMSLFNMSQTSSPYFLPGNLCLEGDQILSHCLA